MLEQKKPAPKGPPPKEMFRRLLPIRLDRLTIQDGEFIFKNYRKEPTFEGF